MSVPPAEFNVELAREMRECYDSPLRFVLLAFDWGQGDLAEFEGPDDWQRSVLTDLGAAIQGRDADEAIQTAIKAGHGVGKSALVAWLVLWLMSTRPHFVGVITANTGDQLSGKTWRELALWHKRAINAHWFTWTATRFYQNDHPETWRVDAVKWSLERPESFAGLHNGGRGQAMIFDEASGIPDKIFEVAEGAMTDPDAFWFLFGNPTRRSGRFFDAFGRFSHRWRRHTVDSRTAKATNKRKIAEMIEDWGLDSDFVRVRVLGEFPASDSDALIAAELLAEAAKREAAGHDRYQPVWGLDVARFGDDRTTLAKRRFTKLCGPVTAWRGLDLMQTCGRVVREWEDCPLDDRPSHIVVDVIGVGAGVVDRLREMGLPVLGVNVAESPSVDGKFHRLRDELWWKGREWFQQRACESRDEVLHNELAGVQYSFTSSGLIKVEPKDDTKERLGASPDLADAFLLTFAVRDQRIDDAAGDRYARARRRAGAEVSAWAA